MKSQKTFPLFYEIQVEGELGDMWASWFEGMSIRQELNGESERATTVLYGAIPDQPALYGVLNKIRDLNLVLLSVKKCEAE